MAQKGQKMLAETKMGVIDRNFRRIAACEILDVDHRNKIVTFRRVCPNLEEDVLTFPISDTAGLEAGMFLDFEEPTPNTAKIWGITPKTYAEQFKTDLAKWRRRQNNEG